MRLSPLFLMLGLTVSGCDSIKKSVIQTDKNVEKLAVAVNVSASSSGAIQNLTERDFDAFSQQRGPLVVVNFYSDSSGSCKEQAPIWEKFAVEFGDRVTMGKVNVDQSKELAERLEVKGIPDVRMYRNGTQVHSIVGAPPEPELRAQMEKYLNDAGEAPKPVGEKKPNTMVNDALGKVNRKGPEVEKPVVEKVEVEKVEVEKVEMPKEEPVKIVKRPKGDAKTKESKEPEKPKEPEKAKEPAMQPMKKDWIPPGMQRK